MYNRVCALVSGCVSSACLCDYYVSTTTGCVCVCGGGGGGGG